MEVSEQIQLKFNGVDIINVQYISNKNITADNKPKVDLSVDPKVFYHEDEKKVFTVVMDIRVSSEDYFTLKLIAVGSFEFSKEVVDTIMRDNLASLNAPAIMFPYVRSFISTFTSNIGTHILPLTIPAQFFKGKIEEIKNPTSNIIEEKVT